MFGRFSCAVPRVLAPHRGKFLDRSEPCGLIPLNRPSPLAARPAPHAVENPANNCMLCLQKSDSRIAASILARLPFAARRLAADLPAAGIHQKADTTRAAECADCSKGFRP